MVGFCRGFRRPTAAASRAAVETPRVPAPPAIARLADEAPPPRVPTPTSEDDWLAQYVEPGQTMAEFLAECPWLSRRKRKSYRGPFVGQGESALEKYPGAAICLLPIGDIGGAAEGPSMEALRRYTEAFYQGIEVRVLPSAEVVVPPDASQPVLWRHANPGGAAREAELRARRHGERIQLQVGGVLEQLRSVRSERPALMVVAVTMHELFDEEPDLFVAGMAAGNHNVAVFSFMRYHPRLAFSPEVWWDIELLPKKKGQKKTRKKGKRKRGAAAAAAAAAAMDEEECVLLQRCCKLLVHEIGHLLGVGHCIHYACCMQGSGHLLEDFEQPSFLCPVCLHKMHALFHFDVHSRYDALAAFCEEHRLTEDAAEARRLQRAVAGSDAAAVRVGAGRRVRGRRAAPEAAEVVDLARLASFLEGEEEGTLTLAQPLVLDRTMSDGSPLPLAERMRRRLAAGGGGGGGGGSAGGGSPRRSPRLAADPG